MRDWGTIIYLLYVYLNAVLVEFSPTRGICGQCLIRIRLDYHEESGFSISGDTIENMRIVK